MSAPHLTHVAVTLRCSAEGRASKGDRVFRCNARVLSPSTGPSFEARKSAHLRMTAT
jgi:hypothetical protein